MIPSQRHLFDIPENIAYLNCAYMSPLLNRVVEIGQVAARRKAHPWRISPPDFFETPERARELFAKLINAKAEDIAVVPAASYGVATAAANIEIAAGQKILILADQFPSNVYAWRELSAQRGAELQTLAWPEDRDWTKAILAALDENTAIVAVANCHWTDGSFIDLDQVSKGCRGLGSALVLDLTQSIGALPFDVAAIRPDFMVAAGYKWMMGPYTLGFLYVDPKYQDGKPFEFNWIARQGSQDFTRLVDYQMDFQTGARRFDMGEGAFFGQMPMAVAALEQLLEWGVENIQSTLRAKTDAIAVRASNLGLVASDPELRAGHFLGLRLPGGLPDGLLPKLTAKDVYVSVRGDSMRVTPHLYNTEADTEKLLDALRHQL